MSETDFHKMLHHASNHIRYLEEQQIPALKELNASLTAELEAVKAENERLVGIEKDHLNDWKRIQDAERELEACRKSFLELVESCEWYADKGTERERHHFLAVEARGNFYDLAKGANDGKSDSEKLAEAIKALEFYGDLEQNKHPIEFMRRENCPETGDFIRADDFEWIDEKLSRVYGKLARQTLEKLRGQG